MKILWYVNVIMPNVAEKTGLKASIGGGWLEGLANSLVKDTDNNLTIVNITSAVKSIVNVFVDGIEYIVLPDKDYIKTFKNVLIKIAPDIIHVHGTEYVYNTDIISLLSKDRLKYVVSIQGVMYQTSKHYCDGLPQTFEKVNPLVEMMGKIYYSDSVAISKRNFEQQGQREIDALRITNNVIGRTQWDKDSILAINRSINYFHINENLRDSFYDSKIWSYNNCRANKIFVSQGFYPIKGLHNLLNILPNLIKKHPTISVMVGGQPAHSLKYKFLDFFVDYFFEYQAYIKKLIKTNNLQQHVNFIGPLNQEQMMMHYLNCNFFLSCSNIENSPNSVAEAMMLGVPVVASDVGGTSTLLSNDEGILYKHLDDQDMMKKIEFALDNPEILEKKAVLAREHALKTHDRYNNIQELIKVYNKIISGEGEGE